MRTIFTTLIVALFLSIGSANSYAAPDKGHRHEPPRREQNDRHKNDKHKDSKKHDKKKNDNRKHDKKEKHSAPRPGHPNVGRPAPPPPPPAHRPGNVHHHPDRLGPMVKYATRGCHDVNVWRIDDESYIVRYRKGRKYYTRRIYPYANRYGAVTVIAPNWQPLSPWINIPPVQININI